MLFVVIRALFKISLKSCHTDYQLFSQHFYVQPGTSKPEKDDTDDGTVCLLLIRTYMPHEKTF